MTLNSLKITIVLLVCLMAFSCKNSDENTNSAAHFIGEWVRNDSNDTFEYKLIFENISSGFITVRNGNSNEKATSSLHSFNWSLENGAIKIVPDQDEQILFSVIENDNDELLIKDGEDLVFKKINN